MIEKVYVRALKSMKNLQVKCSWLNVFVGTNSSGKSTFLQALLLMAQNGRNEDGLNGKLVSLGEFREVRNHYMPKDAIRIEIWEQGKEKSAWIEFEENKEEDTYKINTHYMAADDYYYDEGQSSGLMEGIGFHYLSCQRIGARDIYEKNILEESGFGIGGEFAMAYLLRNEGKPIEFYTSLRECTLPVLKKIREGKGNVIWKKDTFWQSEICNGITLGKIPQKKNERSGEYAAFKIQLTRLAYEEPFWEPEKELEIQIKEYRFDSGYCKKFETVNCFLRAAEMEGRIVSFLHKEYKKEKLPLVFQYRNQEQEYELDNIFHLHWWDREPQIKTWRVGQKYMIEIRANEFDFHPPHFHVSSNERSGVFLLSNGQMYARGKKKWQPHMISEITKWYQLHREELLETWENLHGSLKK